MSTPRPPAKPKRRSLLETLPEVEASAGALTIQADLVQRADQIARERVRLPLDAILDRFDGDTRAVTPSHAEALADSIAAFGLIQPIVVDRHHRLLAGGHRRAAVAHLRREDVAAYERHFSEGVPVYVYDCDASSQPQLALAIEVSENEKRRDYTRAEAIQMATRLRGLGYSYRETAGAPRAGERMLIPALAVMIGKSEKTIRRYLQGESAAAHGVLAPENLDSVQIHARTVSDLRQLLAGDLAAPERAAVELVLSLLEKIRSP